MTYNASLWINPEPINSTRWIKQQFNKLKMKKNVIYFTKTNVLHVNFKSLQTEHDC